ncbi:hypothetical protein DR64_1614 [Paraburkholderia xenovorans LB400]|jgi:hypothetical protein|uniref:hypothetical protein n=1 Tax=Paraburkholderia xenovorans TaxID=36873 RepID=UPI0004F6D879|nr:hypothetical protein [Paraburkholderia xenovorans]AIP30401.1 hypothetical protein DR64_1614 [Paraburkholderia xenovorans LB400]
MHNQAQPNNVAIVMQEVIKELREIKMEIECIKIDSMKDRRMVKILNGRIENILPYAIEGRSGSRSISIK